jgi:hypothetical protein
MIDRCIVLHYLGEKDRACDMVRQFKPRFEHYPRYLMDFYRNQLDYLRNPDQAAAEKWLATSALPSRVQGYMHPFIGLTRLGEGNRVAARRHFELGRKLRDPYYPASVLGTAILARMNKDSDWPPWVQSKKQ